MNNIIEIVEFKNRISVKEDYEPIICGNTNYYLKFTFDEEWSKLINKQVIVEVKGKKLLLDIDENNMCKLPALPNALKCLVMVKCVVSENEVYASNALKIELEPNILSEEVELMEPFSGYCSKLFASVDKIATGDLNVKNSDYANVAGRSETQVSLTGDEEISGVKNFNDGIKKAGEEVPNYSEISNPNLLINPEMLINQRGKNSYSGKGVYAADRWKLRNDKATLTKTESGKWLFSTEDTTTGNKTILLQSVEYFENLKGKYVTATMCISGFTLSRHDAAKLNLFIDDGVVKNFVEFVPDTTGQENLKNSYTVKVSENAKRLEVGLITSYYNKPFSFIFNWAKLEVGDKPTAFMPASYPEDLRNCQRYFQNIRLNGGSSAASSASALYCSIPLPVTMRTTPTIVSYNVPSIRGSGKMFDATSITMNSIYDNAVVLNCYGGGNMTLYNIYSLHNGDCVLDAEIY